ncbi:uncharacterized protein [Epargyreus clarus]|uniref:uncharacterized protein n=1 Tax=Epargyreus clarus TaxID=520877 RepID=UPI003C2CF884
MSNEIHFVREIEKRECLYNHNIPEYNRKDLSEQAWSEVARNRNLTVNECKEKWRNIRSSFLRSMKKSEKVKKPYYLSPYLQFVLPFTKLHQTEYSEEQRTECHMSEDNDADIRISSVKSEPDVSEEQTQFEAVDIEELGADVISEKIPIQRSGNVHTICRRRRRPFTRTQEERRGVAARKQSAINVPNDSSRLSNSSMRYFLLSLLPDFETMTNDQIRMFKIKVMMLIDDIKTNFSEVRQNLNSTRESERLQKRLINLLVKNLKNR